MQDTTHPGADTPDAFVENVYNLVTLPDIWLRLQDILQDPHHDGNEVANLIGYDHSLTARVLTIVNSAYYGLQQRIDRLSHAVTIIGENELNYLVFAASAVQALYGVTGSYPNLDDFWLHSVRCAILSRLIAGNCDVLHPERLFVAGLLHDTGKLVINQQRPDLGMALYADPSRDSSEVIQHETGALGFDHAQVGGALCHAWQLPDSLARAVQYHHEPDSAPDFSLEANIVQVANTLLNATESPGKMTADPAEPGDYPSATALHRCRVDPDNISELMLETYVESLIIKETICSPSARSGGNPR